MKENNVVGKKKKKENEETIHKVRYKNGKLNL